MPLRGVYILNFGKISLKFQFWESYILTGAPMEEWTLRAKFHPHWCNVSPLRGENPHKRPLSNLYTGAFRCGECCR